MYVTGTKYTRGKYSSAEINKYGSYLLSRDWAGLKWRPVLKVWEQLQDKYSKDTQNSYRWKPLAIIM